MAWSPALVAPDLADGESLVVRSLPAERGEVLGAGDSTLVGLRPVVRLGLDKTRAEPGQWKSSARAIARELDLGVADYVARVEAAGEQAFVEALVLRADDAASTLTPAYAAIPGAARLDDEVPLAPTREFAAPLLGSVGEATAEVVEASDGAVGPGRPGRAVRPPGALRRAAARHARRPGRRHRRRGGPHALRAAPDPGRAVAAHPGPRAAGEGGAGAGRDRSGERAGRDPTLERRHPGGRQRPRQRRAQRRHVRSVRTRLDLQGRQLAGPAAVGAAAPRPRSTCDPTTVVDGKTFKNYDDYPATGIGRITLRQAVANSCNTAFISERDRLDDTALADAAGSLGLGIDRDLGFPAYFGQVPAPEGETEKAADLIGQGRVLASPMAMAAVAASVSAGSTVTPRLVVDHEVPAAQAPAPLTPAEADQLRGLMRAVVTDGSGRFLAGLPGAIGAKTGTAEYGSPDASGALPTHTWMIATQGDLAVAVFVETGVSGSQTAGPLLEQFLR